ncbi:MAG: 2-amino-3,7-dideoxy-D-threo-hept-6-ulosonate synthase [Candidatus Methanomethylophilaceae archaeon]|jgi:fructose-bisphosphate aldolase/2-amino-3,7-dideoxy-D-threo-hept-6-ulosonate synthase
MLGKDIRLGRIRDRDTGKYIIVPLDHGVTVGPVKGLNDLMKTVGSVAEGGATAILMHKGTVASAYPGHERDLGLILHLSASTEFGNTEDCKVLVSSVREAIKTGADAVSLHINLGSKSEPEMLHDLGMVSQECSEWGVPLVCMAYVRGNAPSETEDAAHAVRVVSELGADVVKCDYTGDPDSFRTVVEASLVPVVVAGGPVMESDRDILDMVYGAMSAGASGVSIGRNIFQHRNPEKITAAIADIVKNGSDAEEAGRLL